MKTLKFAFLSLSIAASSGISAQQNYEDHTYSKDAVKDRQVVPYPHLREADVAYQKRIERIIDSREKQNVVLNWPRNHFGTLIYKNVLEGNLPAYRNDSLFSIYTSEEVQERGVVKEPTQIVDPNNPDDPYALIDTTITTPFDPVKIIKWRIMEDWIFDKKHSTMIVRIIAIAPMYKPNIGGVELPEQPLFWIKYDEARKILVNQELFNRNNDASRISLDHFFQKRMFSSYVIKKSNEFDYALSDYDEFKDNGLALLQESEKIKNELFIMEHDLWEY